MSVFTRDGKKAFKAGANLSAKQFFAVKLSSGNVVLTAAETDETIGILQNAPVQNDTADVLLLNAGGTTKMIASGVISAGARVTVDTAGKAQAGTQTSAGSQPTKRSVGIAITAAAADGDTIEVMLLPQLF
jgi:hypothetical protein